MQINDRILVVLNGQTYETHVAGMQRNFGMDSPVSKIKFYFDWDEGPLEYWWPIEDVEFIPQDAPDDFAHWTLEKRTQWKEQNGCII